MQLGISISGILFLLMLFIPNMRWTRRKPAGYGEISGYESRALLALERLGQAITTYTAVLFVCPEGLSFPWILWLAAAVLLMVLYEIAWARYFRGGEKLCDMYRPLGPIPVPIASLPIAAFVLLGVWHESPIAIISALILAVGHIGIHLGHARELTE